MQIPDWYTPVKVLCRVYEYKGIAREQSKMRTRCREDVVYCAIPGARTETWGTPAATSLGVENSPSTETLNFLLVTKQAISLMTFFENVMLTVYIVGQSATLCQRLPWCPRKAQSSTCYCWSVALWCALKPKWLAFSELLSSMCLWIVPTIRFSKSLLVVDKRFIGRNCGKLWVLVGFRQGEDSD
jgi:hypothetical protein